jgi:hypothetical protein
MASIYDLASNYELGETGKAPGVRLPMAEAPIFAAPVAAVAEEATSPVPPPSMDGAGRNQQLLSMLGKYFPQNDEYGTEIKAARQTMTQESEAFNKLLQDAIKQPQDSGPSKAEMYFRLAAAFGAPTKTGNFMESLGKAGEAAATMNKEQREAAQAERSRRLSLGLEAQKLRMTGAKEDLTTLRQLAAEGMKDKRTIATELIKEYVKSGQPESSAGKQAKDEGLVPGTPEFQKRVGQIAEMNVDRQMAQINTALANMGTAQANMALQQQKFDFQQTQATKLTPAEVKMKSEAEDALTGLDSSISSLKKAYTLNPNTFDASLMSKAQRKLLEETGSKDPKVQNTREMENLLSSGAVEKLKASFGGNPTEGERAILLSLEGLESKSIEERAKIMKNTYTKLKAVRAARQKRLNEISSGLYRNTGEADTGGLE